MCNFGTRPCKTCREDRLFIADKDGYPICHKCKTPLPRKTHSIHQWVTGTVISKIDGHTFQGRCEINQHHNVLFICAPNEPFDNNQTQGEGDDIPECELVVETYIKLSALPPGPRETVRRCLGLAPEKVKPGVEVHEDPLGTHECPNCGKQSRNITAGCDHCELEDK